MRSGRAGVLGVSALFLVGGMAACGGGGGGGDAGVTLEAGPDAGLDGQVADGPGADGPGADAAAVQAPRSFVVYNAGLAPGAVDLVEERRPLIVDALKQLPEDVICLNEVWSDDDAQAVIDGVTSSYPYHFREQTTDDSTPKVRCSQLNAVTALAACQKLQCANLSITECVTTACKTEYDALADECKICLAAHPQNPTSCAVGGAKDFAMEGRNGLLLLSRQPLVNATYTAFDTRFLKHGVISASIGSTTVRCTYLASNLDVLPYPTGGPYASWAEENAATAADLVASVGTGCSVLLGDLNTGPAVGGLPAELPNSYPELIAGGYVEPWAAPLCTYCNSNPLVDSQENAWIDHVMFDGCPEAATATYARVLDQPVTVTTAAGQVETRLSDHYGLSVTLQ